MTQNLERLRGAMSEKGLSALLLSQIDNVQWATGFTGSNGFLLLTPSEGRFITDGRYTLQAKKQVGDLPVAVYAPGVEGNAFIAQNAQEMGINRIGFEADATTYSSYEKLRSTFSGVELVPVEGLVTPLRAVKTSEEIDKIKRACKLADACFEHVKRMIQPGVSEYDLGLEIEFYFRRNGAQLAFSPIVVSGERSASPHGRASEKKLERGDFLTLDLGCSLDDYCSDITRTVVVGEATDRHREIYAACLASQLAALDAMKPGVIAKDVDRISREAMGEYAQYFSHGLGHGLGRVVHDAGRLNSTSDEVLQPGQVWTVEPGIYIAGFGGVRIEDDVVITESGIENLTGVPKDLLILG